MSVYRGTPAAARRYLEADRSRADDYYLAEGTGIADRYVASPTEGVRHAAGLSGDAYEAWVAGLDPVDRDTEGTLRSDENAVRFVEVTVNGPTDRNHGASPSQFTLTFPRPMTPPRITRSRSSNG